MATTPPEAYLGEAQLVLCRPFDRLEMDMRARREAAPLLGREGRGNSGDLVDAQAAPKPTLLCGCISHND